MSADRLAQIEERVRTRAVRTGNNWAPLSNADVLALVEIAKAARAFMDAEENAENRLYDALERLNSGAAEGDA